MHEWAEWQGNKSESYQLRRFPLNQTKKKSLVFVSTENWILKKTDPAQAPISQISATETAAYEAAQPASLS